MALLPKLEPGKENIPTMGKTPCFDDDDDDFCPMKKKQKTEDFKS